jgi:hypothetical protein
VGPELPMRDVLADQLVEARAELREDVDGLWLLHFPAGAHDFAEVSFAELLDDVVVVGGFLELEESHDVFGVDAPQDVDFVIERGAEVLVLLD